MFPGVYEGEVKICAGFIAFTHARSMLNRVSSMREQIANLLPFFTPREVPERATAPEDALVIHTAMQKVDSAYERFRNLLDPGDEDILRRKAILRFLARRWEASSDPDVFSLALLKDLAYGRYIPNDTHRRLAGEIAVVVTKGIALWELSGRTTDAALFSLLTVDIDRVLYPRDADDALVYALFDDLRARAVWEDPSILEHERETQLFLACHRALAKTDDAELFWHLLRTAEPAWMDAHPSHEELQHMAELFSQLTEQITSALRHPGALRLLRAVHSRAVPYRILRDVIRRGDADRVLDAPESLTAAVIAVLSERIRRLERQMFRRVWHAAVFLFLSKGVLAVALEVPYEILTGSIRALPLTLNILFPPTLLLLMTGSVPRPGRANTERLISLLQAMVHTDDVPPLVIRPPSRSVVRRSVFTFIYGFVALGVLGGILWILRTLDFSVVGGFFFIVFLGLVSFLGLRLRSGMSDIRVVAPRSGLIASLIDFFTLPIIDLGRQIALHASQVNVFLFILDALIEAPFKVLLGLIEEWFSYLREKKEELV